MALYLSGMASTSCSTSDWDRNRGRFEWFRRQRHADRWVDRDSVVRDRRVETLAKREDSFADGGGGEAGGKHLGHPAAYGRVGDPDQWGGAEPGQDLDLQRDLESCAGGQPEVMPGVAPIGGPLLKSDLTATGIAPESVADFELDLGFSAFRVDQAPLCLTVRFAGGIAVTHLVADDRSRAPGLVSLLKLAAFDVRHGFTNPSGRDGRLASQAIPRLPRGGSGRDGRSDTRPVLRLGAASHIACRSKRQASRTTLAESSAARSISCRDHLPFSSGCVGGSQVEASDRTFPLLGTGQLLSSHVGRTGGSFTAEPVDNRVALKPLQIPYGGQPLLAVTLCR